MAINVMIAVILIMNEWITGDSGGNRITDNKIRIVKTVRTVVEIIMTPIIVLTSPGSGC